MPPQSRAQRRRQNASQTRRATDRATRPRPEAPVVEEPVLDNASLEPPVSNIGTSALLDQPAMAPRQARSTRRPVARPVAEPVDYTEDYFHARRDLTRIAIWSVILFAVMIAIRFSGLV